MAPSPERVQVFIYGEQGSGKRTLAGALNGRLHRRSQDSKLFVLDAALGGDVATEHTTCLIAADATDNCTFPTPIIEHLQSITPSTALVLTKVDLLDGDDFSKRARMVGRTRFYQWKLDVETFSVSARQETGLDELVSWIIDVSSPAHLAPSNTFMGSIYDGLLDFLAGCFSLTPRPPRRQYVKDELSELDDASHVQDLIKSATSKAWDSDLLGRLRVKGSPSVRVHRITPSLILKEKHACAASERESIEYVLQHTTIPTPRIHRTATPHLVTDYVDGEMLCECWDRLSRFMQFRIACTLRLYLRQLRSLSAQSIGGIGTRCVSGYLFDDLVYGPFTSIRRFRYFCEWIVFNGWRGRVAAARHAGNPIPPLPRTPVDWTVAFTHGDLNMSNILLDRTGTLWVVDWGEAGFYPRCMETLSMKVMNEFTHRSDYPSSWKGWTGFIAGSPTREEEYFWECMHSAIHRFNPDHM